MSYTRVIPRDLFNEANLLKCYGQLALLLHDYPVPGVQLVHDGGSFEPLQQDHDGSLTLWPSVRLEVRGSHVMLHRPLNDRDSWPLYATDHRDEEEAVFTDDGQFTAGFRAMIGAPAPQGCTCQAYPTHCANDCPEHGLVEA